MLALLFASNSLLGDIKFPLDWLGIGLHGIGLNVILTLLIGCAWVVVRGGFARFALTAALVFLAFLAVSFIVSHIGPCNDMFSRLISTGPIMLLIVLLCSDVGRTATYQDWMQLEKAAQWILVAVFCVFIAEIMFPDVIGRDRYHHEGKYSALFSEPSHAAYSLFPCLVVLLASADRRTRRYGMLAFFGLIVVTKSSTMIALATTWVLYQLFVKGKLAKPAMIALGVACVLLVGAVTNYDKFISPLEKRIMGVTTGGAYRNVSGLIYLQGWQDAVANLQRTKGLGLGFNMMGCTPLPDVAVRRSLRKGVLLNVTDGSFLVSKTVSEAGIIAILLLAVVIRLWIRVERFTAITGACLQHPVLRLQASLMFALLATFFIRSGSYFSGGVLTAIVVAIGMARWYKASQTYERVEISAR